MENGGRLKFYPNNMIAIIAEKPSVGMDIARVVGADTKNDGYCSGNGYMVTWALGHLVSLALPDTYGYTRTAAEDLPMLPEPFRLVSRQVRTDRGMVPDLAATKQLKVIDWVFNRCVSIIVATDAGREGELIFRWIYDYLGCTKPFRRLWISSLTDEAIRKGLEELKDGAEYDSLYAAADSRAKADWLVGMNASRALAIASGTPNSSIGRVQEQFHRAGADPDTGHDMRQVQGESGIRLHPLLATACHPARERHTPPFLPCRELQRQGGGRSSIQAYPLRLRG